MLDALVSHMQRSLVKKAKLNKAKSFADHKSKSHALTLWQNQVAAMKRIRGDKLLWQAHTSQSEFFTVSVKVGAVLDYKQSNPVMQQRHFLIKESVLATPRSDVDVEQDKEAKLRESVKMGLGNMVSV